MNDSKKYRQLENDYVLVSSLLDAIERLVDGKKVSDFELSFPIVRSIADSVTSEQSIETTVEMAKPKTDLDLPAQYRTEANFWRMRFFEMFMEVQKANKGIRRLKRKIDRLQGKITE